MYRKIVKPIIDFVVALVLLILASPVILLVLLLLVIANKGNPVFLQDRGGKDGVVFKVIKFKTMNDSRGADGELLPDSERITFIGNIVRRSSLDELPQLINVLKGDMSLIGPRPFIAQYLPIYNDWQKRRHEVKPGITGWAQINGRNAISWNKKFEYDIWYVDNLSFALDFKILLLTIKKIFKSDDVNQSGSTTAELFNGNN